MIMKNIIFMFTAKTLAVFSFVFLMASCSQGNAKSNNHDDEEEGDKIEAEVNEAENSKSETAVAEGNETESNGAESTDATGTHIKYGGLSLNMTIDMFRKKLEAQGYSLGEKNLARKLYKYYNQFNALWVYYDKRTNKVWNVMELDLHYDTSRGESYMYNTIVPELEKKYHSKVSGFCEGVDCINVSGGCIVFAYDKKMGPLVMYVDEINSRNYDNFDDATYKVSPYGLN